MARIICVGDRNQSIYGFRGADHNAVPNLIEALKAKTLPLSITYRCPKAIVEKAKLIVPNIEANPSAPNGIVREVPSLEAAIQEMKPNDFVLCRCVAPTVSCCMKLLKAGKRAFVKGRDIGQNIISFIDSFDPSNLEDLHDKISLKVMNDVGMLQSKGKEMQAIALQDKAETVFALSEGITTIAELKAKIENLFADDGKGAIMCSTVHKVKGLEANRVYILRPDLIPHPKACTEQARQQEINLEYVAITRVKYDKNSEGELIYINYNKSDERD